MVLQRSSTRDVLRHALAGADLVDGLDAAGRADPAGRALAAGLDGAEFHRKARLLRHVDTVVEYDDTAMADQTISRGKGFIVERRIEQRAWKICTERAADLHGADGATAGGSAADFVDQFAERDAERNLEQAAISDVARELDRHGATRAADAEIGIGLGPASQNERDGRE